MTLGRQRCFHHADREAAARCPECRRTYCRECVTEHRGRVLCASCLARLSAGGRPRGRGDAVSRLALGALGLALAWFAFYAAGRALTSLPASFHEGTLWKEALSRDP